MNDAAQEMTLDQWCARLPSSHLVNRELFELRERLKEIETENVWLHNELTMQAAGWRNEMNKNAELEDQWAAMKDDCEVILSKFKAAEGANAQLKKVVEAGGCHCTTYYQCKRCKALAKLKAAEELDAHELWAMAQLMPGEGIEDGVARLEAALAKYEAGRK